jgi:EpsI family protein
MKGGIIIASVLILLGGAGANYLRYVEPTPTSPPTLGDIPYEFEGFRGEERYFSEQSYEILHADTSTLRLYNDTDGNPIWLFIGYFESQKYGSQIHSPKHCLPGSGWKITSLESYRLQLTDGTEKQVNRLLITERGRQHLMLYWFETRGGTIRNEFALKWDLMQNSLMLRPTDAAIVRINLPLTGQDDIDAGTDKALAFLENILPEVEQSLPFGK